MLDGFESYTGLSLHQLKLSGFLGNRESWRKGTGMSIAEIRPYQPGDTIKQIERRSTAKKSQLMTKLSHQEEQLACIHCISNINESLLQTVQQIVAAISYASLKYGDTVGAVVNDYLYPASRKKTALTSRYGLSNTSQKFPWHNPTIRNKLQRVTRSMILLYTDDFPTDTERELLTQLAMKNTIVYVVIGHAEQFNPNGSKAYQYDGVCLGKSDNYKYREKLDATIRDTRSFLRSINGKLICIESGKKSLADLASQRML